MDVKKQYQTLLRRFGPQGWWPIGGVYRLRGQKTDAELFEIMVGAILTQNTAWKNVEQALGNLRAARTLRPERIIGMPRARLERLIRPAGYFRQKSKKLKILSRWLARSPFVRLRVTSTDELRRELLALWGIGPETADSILLYAFDRPVFVVDAYTLRLCRGEGRRFKSYDACQRFFESHLPGDAKLFNEYHALIVAWGKRYGQKRRTTRRPK